MHSHSSIYAIAASTTRKILILIVCLFSAGTMSAEEEHDSAYLALYRHYYQLYDTDSTEEFYRASEQLQQNYMRKGNIVAFYKIWQNEIFYDSDHGNVFEAITKATKLLEYMNGSKTKNYELPYMSLGYIFETRGTYRVAAHFYQEALSNIDSQDSMSLAHVYSQLAILNLARDVKEAEQWVDLLGSVISHDSLYYKSYLTLKGEIYFFKGDKENFFRNKREFDDFSNRTSTLDQNGEHVLKIMEYAFLGQYNEALQLLLIPKIQEYNDLRCCDIRIRIYEMMGQIDWALAEADKQKDIRDSLHNDLLFTNLNSLNAAVGVSKVQEKAAKDRESLLKIIISLLLVALLLFVSRYISRHRHQQKIKNKNKQLEIALNEAKGSERMKDIFIQRIGSEIRTPLHVITGYTQIITNPDFELEKEEYEKMMQAINQNTTAITDLVNDMLAVSKEESKETTQE